MLLPMLVTGGTSVCGTAMPMVQLRYARSVNFSYFLYAFYFMVRKMPKAESRLCNVIAHAQDKKASA